LAIPTQAVDAAGDDSSGQVVVVTPEKRIDIRTVTLGLQTATKIEIRSGLAEGDLVVVGSRAGLKEGQEVLPKITIDASKAVGFNK
jgi:hypothetical protein